MTNLKRIVSVLLCVMLMASAVAFAEGNVSLLPELYSAEEYAARLEGTKVQRLTDEPKTFTAWVTVGGNGGYGTILENLNDMPMVKAMAEKTGVSLDFIVAPMGQDEVSFTKMLANPKKPDIIFAFDYNFAEGGDAAIEQGIIIDINDYMDCLPNYDKVRRESDFRFLNTLTDDGHQPYICSFPYKDYLGEVCGGPIIRQDLLDKLGLDTPVTIDDWYEFLTRCRDELGMTRILGMNYNIINKYNAFNCTFGYGAKTNTGGEAVFQIDGVVQYAPLTEGYRQYIETMRQWYAEGLVDPDFSSTLTFDDGIALLTGNQCAAAGENAYALDFVNSMGRAVEPDFTFVAVPNPVLNEGDQIHIHYPEGNNLTKVCAISTSCEDPELVLSYIDQYFTDEGFILANFGIEGQTYTVVDGMPTYTDLVINNPDGRSATDVLNVLAGPPASNGWFMEGIVGRDGNMALHERSEVWKSNADNEWQLPAVNLNQEEKAVYSRVWGDLDTYVEEMSVKFIMGLESMDKYDEFVENIVEKFHADEMIAAYQSALDRFNAR